MLCRTSLRSGAPSTIPPAPDPCPSPEQLKFYKTTNFCFYIFLSYSKYVHKLITIYKLDTIHIIYMDMHYACAM